MQENKKLVPKRRFKEFQNTDAWEQRKLEDLAISTYGGGTPTTSNSGYWDGNIPWIQSSDLTENKVSGVMPRKYISKDGLKNSATKLVPPYSIAIITRVGVGKLAVIPFSYTTSQDFLSLSNLKTDVWFSVYAIYKKLQGELNAVQGTSIKGITKEELLSKVILIPKTEEQLQIGQFFQNIDRLITLHQRKIEKTKALKAAFLSEMFPTQGEREPKRRFAGFTGAWEQRKLDDFGPATSGTSIESEFSNDGKYKVISIGSYSENSVYTDQGIRAVESEKTIKRVLNEDDLTMILNDKTASGNIIGRVLRIEKSGIYVYNQRTQRIEPKKEKFDTLFLYQLLNAPLIREKVIKQSQGNTQIYVNWSNIKEITYLIPSLPEQKKIGEYFENLDNLITLHQRKLEKLQNIKRAYLNEMFI